MQPNIPTIQITTCTHIHFQEWLKYVPDEEKQEWAETISRDEKRQSEELARYIFGRMSLVII